MLYLTQLGMLENMVDARFDDFLKIDIRVGEIIEAAAFPEAHKPAYELKIDSGDDIGIKKSSAQITACYSVDKLVGVKIMAVVNFPPRQIGPFVSEVLTLGVADEKGDVILVSPNAYVPNGSRLF
ncbi:tRNA-binding protein [Bartonella tamiae]|uniref:tRNA-binding domain-containing protein n=1 Tax=Bartonella tamiae Th239 TaxID=1094558 RepID=J0QTG1_9HYPH|nr:tRNA-binding protein [Bartonella tamiae]EJF89181.1 hypothetical protein ME5_01732 [Bartonella tamiae Th239]EJF95416.1 hypothetical protein MEG_00149 [Bartonella tamiae Th307]